MQQAFWLADSFKSNVIGMCTWDYYGKDCLYFNVLWTSTGNFTEEIMWQNSVELTFSVFILGNWLEVGFLWMREVQVSSVTHGCVL